MRQSRVLNGTGLALTVRVNSRIAKETGRGIGANTAIFSLTRLPAMVDVLSVGLESIDSKSAYNTLKTQ